MAQPPRNGLVSGFILGVLIAFIFAVVIRFIPADWLLNPVTRAWLYAAQVPAGLLFIPVAMAVARARASALLAPWKTMGSMTFWSADITPVRL